MACDVFFPTVIYCTVMEEELCANLINWKGEALKWFHRYLKSSIQFKVLRKLILFNRKHHRNLNRKFLCEL